MQNARGPDSTPLSRGEAGDRDPKSEIRKPKEIRISKSEYGSDEMAAATIARLGIRSSDFLRHSGFGFRTAIRHSFVYNRCVGWKDRPVFENAMKPQAAPALSRRQFLKRATAAAALPLIVPGSVLGLNGAVAPNNRIGFGAMGVGNRAMDTLPTFLSFPDIQYVAVSDFRADRLKNAKAKVDAKYGNQDCAAYPDFREMLERKDVDAVAIATGNRWHGLGSMYAARAGKDIYCEKPVTLTIGEGRKLVDTCRRFGTIYQAGTQRRSTASYGFAMEMVRQGRIGHLHTVEMQVWEGPGIPHDKVAPVPKGWDYDKWLGQSPWYPFVPARVNSWQYFWDTAEGVMTDMGEHYTDQMQWALDTDNTGPCLLYTSPSPRD